MATKNEGAWPDWGIEEQPVWLKMIEENLVGDETGGVEGQIVKSFVGHDEELELESK